MVSKLTEWGFEKYCVSQRELGLSNLPPLIIWEVTLRCNQRCKFCGFYGENAVHPTVEQLVKELNEEECIKAIDDIAKCYKTYKPHIGLIGGETFLKVGIVAIMDRLGKHKIPFSLTSNLTFLKEEFINAMVRNKIQEVRVSLHGNAEAHNELVMMPKDAFKITTDNIKRLRQAGINVKINFVITDQNVHLMEYMLGLAKELDCKVRFQHLEFISTNDISSHTKFMMEHFKSPLPVKYGTTFFTKVDELLKFIKKHPEAEYEPSGLTTEQVIKYYNSSEGTNCYTRRNKCWQVWGSVRIDPNGNLFPCVDYYYGNLRNDTFKNIWRNNKAKEFKTLLKQEGLFPGCNRCCKL